MSNNADLKMIRTNICTLTGLMTILWATACHPTIVTPTPPVHASPPAVAPHVDEEPALRFKPGASARCDVRWDQEDNRFSIAPADTDDTDALRAVRVVPFDDHWVVAAVELTDDDADDDRISADVRHTLWLVDCQSGASRPFFEADEALMSASAPSHDGTRLFFTGPSGIDVLDLDTRTTQALTHAPPVGLPYIEVSYYTERLTGVSDDGRDLYFDRVADTSHFGLEGESWILRNGAMALGPTKYFERRAFVSSVARDARGQLWLGDAARCGDVSDWTTVGGVWTSADDGSTWRAVPIPDMHGPAAVVLADPRRPGSVVVLAAVCWFDDAEFEPDGELGGTLHRTRDGGKRWTKVPIWGPDEDPDEFGVPIDVHAAGDDLTRLRVRFDVFDEEQATVREQRKPGGAFEPSSEPWRTDPPPAGLSISSAGLSREAPGGTPELVFARSEQSIIACDPRDEAQCKRSCAIGHAPSCRLAKATSLRRSARSCANDDVAACIRAAAGYAKLMQPGPDSSVHAYDQPRRPSGFEADLYDALDDACEAEGFEEDDQGNLPAVCEAMMDLGMRWNEAPGVPEGVGAALLFEAPCLNRDGEACAELATRLRAVAGTNQDIAAMAEGAALHTCRFGHRASCGPTIELDDGAWPPTSTE